MSRNYSSVASSKTLASPVAPIDTQIALNNLTGLPSTPYTLVLNPDTTSEEIVTVNSVASGTTLNVSRGQEGTTAGTHSPGNAVRHMITGRDLQDAQDHIAATTAVHGLTTGISVVGDTSTQTLTNKTISLGSNTVTGTKAQFNAAMSDDDFATITGTETLTNKTLTSPKLNENVAVTTTATELNYVSGVTSSIQTQLGTKAATSGKLSQFAATSSSELAGVISDETGSGSLVFATSPSLVTPSINSTVQGYSTTATSAGTTALTATSNNRQFFTGTSTHTVTLPTTSVVAGQWFEITNLSTGNVTVNASGGTATAYLSQGSSVRLTANVATPTTPAGWHVVFSGANSGGAYALPYCRVWRSAALNIANNATTYTQIPWDAVTYNNSAMWSSGNAGFITVPVSGMYHVSATYGYAANSTGSRTTYIGSTNSTLNIIALQSIDGLGTGNTTLTISETVPLIAGDSLALNMRQNSGGSLGIYAGTYYGTHMSVAYIGPSAA